MDGTVGQGLGKRLQLGLADVDAFQAETGQVGQAAQSAEIRDRIIIQIQGAQAGQGGQGHQVLDVVIAEIQGHQATHIGQGRDIADAVIGQRETVQRIKLADLGEDGIGQPHFIQHQAGGGSGIFFAGNGDGFGLGQKAAAAVNSGDAGGNLRVGGVHAAENFQGLGIVALVLIAVHHQQQAVLRAVNGRSLPQGGKGAVIIAGLITAAGLVQVIVIAFHFRHTAQYHGHRNNEQCHGRRGQHIEYPPAAAALLRLGQRLHVLLLCRLATTQVRSGFHVLSPVGFSSFSAGAAAGSSALGGTTTGSLILGRSAGWAGIFFFRPMPTQNREIITQRTESSCMP